MNQALPFLVRRAALIAGAGAAAAAGSLCLARYLGLPVREGVCLCVRDIVCV